MSHSSIRDRWCYNFVIARSFLHAHEIGIAGKYWILIILQTLQSQALAGAILNPMILIFRWKDFQFEICGLIIV